MKCVNCGAEIMSGAQFCHICGATQPAQQGFNGGQQPYQQQPFQGYNNGGQQQYQQMQPPPPPYQQPYQQQPYQNLPVSNEDAPIWMKVISLLVPIVGIILWAAKKSREPVAAKSCLTWGLIGIAVAVFLDLYYKK